MAKKKKGDIFQLSKVAPKRFALAELATRYAKQACALKNV